MDSSFFLPLCACISVMLYTGSLLISIQFRGDFGIMSDDVLDNSMLTGSGGLNGGVGLSTSKSSSALLSTNRRNISSTNLNLNASNRSPIPSISKGQTHLNNNPMSKFGNVGPYLLHSNSLQPNGPISNNIPIDQISNSSTNEVGNFFDIPRGDVALLFSPPISGYGTKLHNVKLGQKDV